MHERAVLGAFDDAAAAAHEQALAELEALEGARLGFAERVLAVLLEDLRDVASDGAQQLKSLPEGDQLIIAMLYASNAMASKKKPTNDEVTAYVQLVRCVMAYHDDSLSTMLQRFKSQLEDSEQETESD